MAAQARHVVVPLTLLALLGTGLSGCALVAGDRSSAGDVVVARDGDAATGSTSYVVVPSGRLDVTVGDPVAEVADDDTRDLDGTRAPDGGELVPVSWSFDTDAMSSVATLVGAPRALTVSLEADGRSYPLDPPYSLDGRLLSRSAETDFYVAVDGEPDALSLRVQYDGLAQSVDLRTGERDAGPAAGLYDLPETQDRDPGCAQDGWSDDPGVRARVDCTIGAPTALPYVDDAGWAQEGHQWLTVPVSTRLLELRRSVGGGEVEYLGEGMTDASALDGSDPVTILGEGYDFETLSGVLVFDIEAGAGEAQRLDLGRRVDLRARRSDGVRGDYPQRVTLELRHTVRLTAPNAG